MAVHFTGPSERTIITEAFQAMLLIQSAPSNPLNDATWLVSGCWNVWHILGFALSVGTIAHDRFQASRIRYAAAEPCGTRQGFRALDLVWIGQHVAIRSAHVRDRPGHVLPESILSR